METTLPRCRDRPHPRGQSVSEKHKPPPRPRESTLLIKRHGGPAVGRDQHPQRRQTDRQQKAAPSEPGKQADQHEDSAVVATSEAESDRSVDDSPRGRSPAHAQYDHRTEIATSSPSGGVGSDAAWEPRIAGKMAPAGFPTARGRAIFGPFRPPRSRPHCGWVHSGWSYSNAQFPRCGDSPTISRSWRAAGTSGPVGSALSYVILRRGCNRGTSDAACRTGP